MFPSANDSEVAANSIWESMSYELSPFTSEDLVVGIIVCLVAFLRGPVVHFTTFLHASSRPRRGLVLLQSRLPFSAEPLCPQLG